MGPTPSIFSIFDMRFGTLTGPRKTGAARAAALATGRASRLRPPR